jgi:tellurite resistance protein TerC
MVWVWCGFVAFVLLVLALDLGVFHRRARAVTLREALGWSAAWIALGLAFSVFVYHGYENQWLGLGASPDPVERTAAHPEGRVNDGRAAVLKYLTGYVVEKSLSVDNVFVMAMIFSFLRVPAEYQHRVLFWGILGALALRGVMIGLGARLIAEFSWILYVFGGFLILTAAKMLLAGDGVHPERSWAVRLVRRVFRVTPDFHGQHFLARDASGALALTPLALALVMVETTDVIFAVDSIPAIFAITADPFLVFTSNVFAILGLRSLYFALAGAMEAFRYLKVSLAAVLALVGVKMLAHDWLEEVLGPNANLYLLLVVGGVLAAGMIVSRLNPAPSDRERTPAPRPLPTDGSSPRT